MKRPILLIPLLLLGACSGIHVSNVGVPSRQTRWEFEEKLLLVHPGMPEDSLSLLFPTAERAGSTGLLHRSSMITDDRVRSTWHLGWKEEPTHTTDPRDIEKIDVIRGIVEVQDGRVRGIKVKPVP
ncbi:MAG: hypothetical protein QF492_04340 [Candidatus Krumholzibacteria bacterium]|nr:hypothetical protein [Candidatus Krumholzibacteria bacterium]MDP6669121.1 hypothetical protein [Candidatus Krumholzibacteria bacterium]MDP6796491.1 hypothetical protein [Candidatus Krumholzibacteria bacterium]MDP7021989.1 hypothetical protein [Candidatus Krumholzibacteria bacterium]